MPIVRHPRVPEITRRVSAAELSNWLAQGWTGPAETAETPADPVDAAPTETPTEPDPAPTDAAPRRSNQRRHRGAASEGD